MPTPTRFAGILRTAAMKRVKARLAAEDLRLLHELELKETVAAIVEEEDDEFIRGRLFLVPKPGGAVR